jgi:hypothetical protein
MVTSPKGLGLEKDCAGESQQYIPKASRQRGRPEKQVFYRKKIIGLDTKTYWLTDRQSQFDFDLTLT